MDTPKEKSFTNKINLASLLFISYDGQEQLPPADKQPSSYPGFQGYSCKGLWSTSKQRQNYETEFHLSLVQISAGLVRKGALKSLALFCDGGVSKTHMHT